MIDTDIPTKSRYEGALLTVFKQWYLAGQDSLLILRAAGAADLFSRVAQHNPAHFIIVSGDSVTKEEQRNWAPIPIYTFDQWEHFQEDLPISEDTVVLYLYLWRDQIAHTVDVFDRVVNRQPTPYKQLIA